MRPAKEFLFITDKNPRPLNETRESAARLIRGWRARPEQYRVWRKDGMVLASIIGTPSVVGAVRTKQEAV